jgi:hypothetical protein
MHGNGAPETGNCDFSISTIKPGNVGFWDSGLGSLMLYLMKPYRLATRGVWVQWATKELSDIFSIERLVTHKCVSNSPANDISAASTL